MDVASDSVLHNPLPRQNRSTPLSFVLFRLERQTFAVALERVERVLRMVAVTAIPEAPAAMAGIINLHGESVPVFHARLRLGLPPRSVSIEDRLMILTLDTTAPNLSPAAVQDPRRLALIVDEVREVCRLPADQMALPPANLPASHPVRAVLHPFEEMILVIDVDRLFVDWTG